MSLDLTERVKHTQKKLRLLTISSVLTEFDCHIMGLDEGKRKLKYEKMAISPFQFYRGSSYLFYFDMGREWFPYHSSPQRPTWIQGDLHFENFGAFRSETGRIVFDVNDFDEGYTGSYLNDLLRMCVSIALVGQMKEFGLEVQKDLIDEYLSAYLKQIRKFAKRKEDPHDAVYDERVTDGPIRKLLKKMGKRVESHLLEGLTELQEGGRQFIWTEEIQQPTAQERDMLISSWNDYLGTLNPETKKPDAYYQIKDIAVKHGSGTASIGLTRFYVLIEGAAGPQALDDIIIELKEVRAPVPSYFMPYNELFWAEYAHQGKRVIMTQQAMHHEADPFLGFMTMEGRHFYARERSPFKKKLKLEKIESFDEWQSVIRCMGEITAKMHARADVDVQYGILSHHSEDEIVQAIGADTDAFREYLANWALSYAQQVEDDYVLFIEWLEQRAT